MGVTINEFNELFQISIDEVTENISIDVTTGSGGGSGDYNDLLNKPDLSIYATESDLNVKADTTYVDTQDSALEGRILSLEGDITSKATQVYVDGDISTVNTRIDNLDLSGDVSLADVDQAEIDAVASANAYTDTQIGGLSIPSVDGLASETYVDQAEADANAYTDTQIGLLNIPSTDGLATTGYVDQAEADAVSTSNAYTDGQVAGLASTTYVDQAEADAKAYADANRPDISGKADTTYVDAGLADKVDKVAGKGLSDTNYTQAEKDKLAGLEPSKFKGTYVSESALTTTHATAEEGSYAHVDAGVGNDVVLYIWDNDDAEWTLSGGTGTSETASSIKTKYESNPDTNAYDDSSKSKVDGLPTNVESVEGATAKANAAESAANSYTDTALTSKEDSFVKNDAFNKSFGTTLGTVAQGNDSRILNGDTAYSWGDHSVAGYLTSYTETDPIFSASEASNITVTDTTNWDSAYSWGNHASAGYLTSFTETDPIFVASPAYNILTADITNWDTAYGWGDHSTAGYLTSFTESDPVFTASPAGGILAADITNWNTAFGWGDHNTQGYLTSVTKADVGLGNVDNTSDLDKPVSTATQTALDGKVDDAQVLTNVPLGAVFTDTVYDDTALQSEVDGKADAVHTHVVADITDFPSIPSTTSDLTNDSGYITSAALPTNVSELTNDAGYITSAPEDTTKLDKQTNIQAFWRGTQAEYDALTPDDNTIYFIEG